MDGWMDTFQSSRLPASNGTIQTVIEKAKNRRIDGLMVEHGRHCAVRVAALWHGQKRAERIPCPVHYGTALFDRVAPTVYYQRVFSASSALLVARGRRFVRFVRFESVDKGAGSRSQISRK